MEVRRIIAEIDAQILKLQQARTLLAGTMQQDTYKGPGRPKSGKPVSHSVPKTGKPSKRKLSPEGRKRIADAMKKRWAERRKQNAKG